MSAEKVQNVQDVFLNHIRKNKTPVTIFLVNGVKLQGIITWFDKFSVLLRRDAHTPAGLQARDLHCDAARADPTVRAAKESAVRASLDARASKVTGRAATGAGQRAS